MNLPKHLRDALEAKRDDKSAEWFRMDLGGRAYMAGAEACFAELRAESLAQILLIDGQADELAALRDNHDMDTVINEKLREINAELGDENARLRKEVGNFERALDMALDSTVVRGLVERLGEAENMLRIIYHTSEGTTRERAHNCAAACNSALAAYEAVRSSGEG